nr:immunoglobulin heavy chain junction region [Mus musculus]
CARTLDHYFDYW